MKKKKGFTLIELLAVIVILAVIALIATPLIMGTITKAKKNAFKDTAYGILKAGEKYTAEILLESENTYPGEIISLPETGSKKLNYKGQEPKGGQMVISKKGDISLVIYNDSWCAIKNAEDKEVKVEKYDKDSCKLSGGGTDNSTPSVQNGAEQITSKNTNGNTEGLFTDDYGNIRYRGSNSEVKNYVSFNNEIWRIIGVFEGKVKLIRSESLIKKYWNDAKQNNWDTSTLKEYFNGEYYNSMSATAKNQIEKSIYYLGGHNTSNGIYAKTIYEKERGTTVYSENPTTTNQNIGLMYPSDYGYAARSSCINALNKYHEDVNCSTEGNWLYTVTKQWVQTAHSVDGTKAFYINRYGNLDYSDHVTLNMAIIRPVIYLKSDIKITDGDGTSSNPYILE